MSVALVTGAGRGIGLAVARALAAEGRTVVVTDVDPDGVAAAAREIEDAVARTLDVTDRAAVDALVDDVERTVGPISVLANVAGVLRAGPVADCTDEDWDALFAVNATGVFAVSRAVARRMVPRGAGCIVTVASNAAGVPRKGMAAYGASKAAAAMFTRSLGLELAADGIRCNIVAPGSTDTPMLASLGAAHDALVAGDLDAFKVGIPLGRVASPEDVADAVAFLASDRARHITMQALYVDGGATLRA